MNVLKINPERPQKEIIDEASKILLAGGVIVYPTDTVYGIGSILDDAAVNRVFSAKDRMFGRPLSVAFSDIEQVINYAVVDAEQLEKIRELWCEGTTFILNKRGVPDYVTAGLPTVGVRIPDSEVCRQIIRRTGPITTTSANLSGQNAPAEFSEIDRRILESVDLALDGGRCRLSRPSRILDLTSGGKILRE